MRCTHCSEQVKPVVCLDIDGTLGDYHSHFLEFAEQYLDKSNTPVSLDYDGKGHFRDWFCSMYAVDVTTFREIKLAYRQGAQKRTMPMYRYASELTSSLTQAGIEIWMTTTRPYLSLDGVDRDTREWLKRNNISYDRLLYDENKYEILASRIDGMRVLAVLDDERQQCNNADAAWGAGTAMLRGTRYNRAVNHPKKVEDLESANRVIISRLAEWRKQHGS